MHAFVEFPFAAEENFALLRPANQSSTYGDMVASKAVDGNSVDDSSSTATGDNDYYPWWKVELDYPIWITHVGITNRRRAGLDEHSLSIVHIIYIYTYELIHIIVCRHTLTQNSRTL